MSPLANTLPYGLRDVRITPLGADGKTPGTPVDLPVARTFSFSETEDFEELAGDDQRQATHGAGPVVEWSLESGGISLEAYAAMAGGIVTTTGVTPNQKKTYTKLSTDTRPEFKVEGQSISDSGGDFHTLVYRCKADGALEGEQANGAFRLMAASGKGYGSLEATSLGKLYDFVQNEMVTPIP
jgi:hypothetical protein